MTVKSIVDIELNSDKFKHFSDLFAKYQDQLAKSPAAWAKVNKETVAAQKNMDRITAALLAHRQIEKEEAETAAKKTKNLTLQERLWTSMSRSTKDVAKNIENATVSLLRWTGVISAVGGLFGLGGLWGLEHMASRVTDQRNSSRGLGVSIGEQRSFGINLRGMVNSDALLSGTSEALSDVTKQGGLQALGVNTNGSTADVALSLLKAVRAQALATPLDNLGMLESKYHIGAQGFDIQALRTLKGMSATEFDSHLSNLQADSKSLNVNDDTAYRWSKFTAQMERAGNQIENIFVKGLQNLADPLAHLSKSVMTLLDEAMAHNGPLSKGIDAIAKWIDSFATNIAKPEYLDKVRQFVSDTGALADAMHAMLHPIDTAGNWAGSKAYDLFNRDETFKSGATGKYMDFLKTLEMQHNLPEGFLRAQKIAESGSSMDFTVSKRGAEGVMQFTPETAKRWGVDTHSPESSARGAAMMDEYLSTKYNHDMAKVLAAYNMGENGLDRLIKDHPNTWQQYLGQETKDYVTKQLGPNALTVTFIGTPGGFMPQVFQGLAPGK